MSGEKDDSIRVGTPAHAQSGPAEFGSPEERLQAGTPHQHDRPRSRVSAAESKQVILGSMLGMLLGILFGGSTGLHKIREVTALVRPATMTEALETLAIPIIFWLLVGAAAGAFLAGLVGRVLGRAGYHTEYGVALVGSLILVGLAAVVGAVFVAVTLFN